MAARRSGGGFSAVIYVLKKARESGGIFAMARAMRSRNACKTCALGMGGQKGGMVNEAGRFPEVCKKSVQAMTADMQPRIPASFFEDNSIDELRLLSSLELESAGRLAEPVYAGPGDSHYKPIGWDVALELVASKIKVVDPQESFFYFSGRSSNEAGFLLQLFARLFGTNHVNNCSYFCHQASGVGLSSVTGSGAGTIVLEDLDHCDLVFLIGANPASNHPRLMKTLLDLRRRGGKVIVVNPLRETGLDRFKVPSDFLSLLFGSRMNDHYVQPHAGGDLAFLAGVAKAIVEMEAVDADFIVNHTEDWRAFSAQIGETSWKEIVSSSGVSQEEIEEIASLYSRSKKTVFCWAMGVTHHAHGVGNVQMIANLAMMRGMLGRPHCGLLPLRGHSNVQGIGSMGVVPALKEEVFSRLQTHFGFKLPTWKGLDTLGCIEAAAAGRMKFGFCLGGNLFGSNPDSSYATSALSRVDFLVSLSTTLNTGHAWGGGRSSLILPVLARDEEQQSTTQESMFSFVRVSDGGPRRLMGPRSEVSVISDLASRLFGDSSPVDWKGLRDHGRIRDAISEIVPGYERVGSGEEFQIAGRTFHSPTFATESGRAAFHTFTLPTFDSSRLRLMTVRSEGQFNTVVYEEEDRYRGQTRRDVVMMSAFDVSRLGLTVGDLVTVTSDIGSLSGLTLREIDVRPGNIVMYFPEANPIVPRHADPASRTPAFKCVPVSVVADASSQWLEDGTRF